MWKRFFRWIWVTILGVTSLLFKPGHVQEAPPIDPEWCKLEWYRQEQPHIPERGHPYIDLGESFQTAVVSGEATELPPGQVLMSENVRSYAARFPFKNASWVTNTATTRLEG